MESQKSNRSPQHEFDVVVQFGDTGMKEHGTLAVIAAPPITLHAHGITIRGRFPGRERPSAINIELRRTEAIGLALSLLRGAKLAISTEKVLDILAEADLLSVEQMKEAKRK